MSDRAAAEEAAPHGPWARLPRRRIAEGLASIGLLVIFLGGWELLSRVGFFHRVILPAPTNIWRDLLTLVSADFFPQHFWTTMSELSAGFAIGSGAALVAGVVVATLASVKRVLYPYIIGFQILPKIVLAPIFITWFGFGIESKIAMAVVICFFPTFINTIVGLESVDPEARRLMHSFRATRWQTFRKLALPHSLPIVFAGLKTSLTFAIIGAIVGEFVGARTGLGYLITAYNFQLRTTYVFALILILSVLGLALYLALAWAERRIVFWRGSGEW